MTFARSYEFVTKTALLIPPQSVAQGATVGDGAGDLGVSRQGFQDVILKLHLGAVDDSFSVACKLQHANRQADGTAPADGDFADATGLTGGSDTEVTIELDAVDGDGGDNATYIMRVRGECVKEYVRPVVTNGAGSGVALLAAEVVLCDPQYDGLSDDGNIKLFKK